MASALTETPKTICITIRHPARVHLFKNMIFELNEMGHKVHVYIVGSGIITDLLDQYCIEYEQLASVHDTLPELVFEQMKIEIRLLHRALKVKPDIMIDGIATQHVSKVVGATALSFMDTEHATFTKKMTVPFADKIFTPDCYRQDYGEKQIRYPGFHELAYLHPNRFEPDSSILEEAGVTPNERFVILRTVAWKAVHDVGDSGFDDLYDVVTSLEETGVQVFITSEAPLPDSVSDRRLTIEPHRIHHLMYYADLFIGESATMATESAVLGTPAIFVSSSRRGYTDELEEEYGLVFNYSGPDRQINGLNQAISILNEYDDTVWRERREQLLEEKIDTTEFITDQITSMQS